MSLCEAAIAVLTAPNSLAKKARAEDAIKALQVGQPIGYIDGLNPPDQPARPEKPDLVPPGRVARRRLGSPQGRAALLHAIAHIEFNAIDLAFDMAIRFVKEIAPLGLDDQAFVADWFGVGGDEARHFGMIEKRLVDFGTVYGDLPAHNGLWEAAEKTSNHLLARLVVAPLILEARGLDVTPGMITRLRGAGDHTSADLLEVIYREEIGHVACGKRWFHAVCKAQGKDPVLTFQSLRDEYFEGGLKPPFNHEARQQAGLLREYYEPN